eukprot:COSAG02_NODE_66608_length_255_cov_0.634615_1_plen_40_part_10
MQLEKNGGHNALLTAKKRAQACEARCWPRPRRGFSRRGRR